MSLPAESRLNEHELFRVPLSMEEAVADAKRRYFGQYRADTNTQSVFEAGWKSAYRHMHASLKEVA